MVGFLTCFSNLSRVCGFACPSRKRSYASDAMLCCVRVRGARSRRLMQGGCPKMSQNVPFEKKLLAIRRRAAGGNKADVQKLSKNVQFGKKLFAHWPIVATAHSVKCRKMSQNVAFEKKLRVGRPPHPPAPLPGGERGGSQNRACMHSLAHALTHSRMHLLTRALSAHFVRRPRSRAASVSGARTCGIAAASGRIRVCRNVHLRAMESGRTRRRFESRIRCRALSCRNTALQCGSERFGGGDIDWGLVVLTDGWRWRDLPAGVCSLQRLPSCDWTIHHVGATPCIDE